MRTDNGSATAGCKVQAQSSYSPAPRTVSSKKADRSYADLREHLPTLRTGGPIQGRDLVTQMVPHLKPISRTGNVCSIYRKRPTSLSILLRGSSSRSASVSSCPHSQSKKVRAERQTDSGPPSTTFSPHSSQRRTTCLPGPSISTPSASFYLRGRHPLTLIWSPQGEPASTMRDLCFTR